MATFQIKADTADEVTATRATTTTTTHQSYQQQTNLKQRARSSCGLGAADRLQLQQETLSSHNNRHRRRGPQSTIDPPPPPVAEAAHPKHKYSATRSTTIKSSRVGERKRQPLVAAGVTPFRLAPHNILRIDSVFIMITMLVVVAVVISGNSVFAAQRDSFKPKDPNSLSNNPNTIPNGIASNGNTNNASKENTNANSSAAATSTVSAAGSSSSSSSTSVSAITTSSTTTTTTTASTIRSSIASSSLHKVSSSSGINRNAIEVVEENRNGPYFDKAASKNITALLGKTAYLNCRVKNLGNKTMLLQVSWVRHRDIHLLTVGRYTYTSDQRFRAIHQPQTEDWILQIKYPQHRDSGIYECQVSTTPHMSHYIHLNVVEPSTEIIGAPDLYIESGSTINLTCVILNSPEPPAYIFWNHNNAIINYDSPRGGVSVVTNKGDTTTSFLLIKSARPSDSGHYQCNPSNAKSKSVTVHVLNGEFPAAMQRAAPALPRMSQSHYLLVYLSVYLFTLASVKRFTRLPAHFMALRAGEQRIMASAC